MENTAIEWAEHTINFYIGCSKVSEGCANCYMFRLENRFGRDPTVVRKTKWETIEKNLAKWSPAKIFVNSMSDTFHESLTYQEIDEMFKLMFKYPKHQYLILTKRIGRAQAYADITAFPPNFWIGTSVESQKHIDRINTLCEIPANIHFVSFEPLLGEINLNSTSSFDWAIVGGESGYKPRIPNAVCFSKLIDQLRNENIPVFFKQWGGTSKCKCHGAWGCRNINGKTFDEMPRNIVNLEN